MQLWWMPTNVAAIMGGAPQSGNDAYTVSLLHFDGADGSTTFTDSAAGGSHTWARRGPSGTAQLDTAQGKFGVSSLQCIDTDSLTDDGIESADSTDWAMGSGDFTVDFWVRFAAATLNNDQVIIGWRAAAGNPSFQVSKNAITNVLRGRVTLGGVHSERSGTTGLVADAWYHVAWVRTGDTMKLFLNGTQEGADLSVSGSMDDLAVALVIGNNGQASAFPLNGWIDEVRISKGIARWTANFTPPTAAYGPG